jgi:hemerythrin-like domain-containing protein
VLTLNYTMTYAELLTQHIQKENNILFNMADQMFTAEEHARLQQNYQTAIPDGSTAETGAHYEEMVANLCQRWNVDPRKF